MKKTMLILLLFALTSCATLYGGKKDECQTMKPIPGQPVRSIRWGWLVADVMVPTIGVFSITDNPRESAWIGMIGVNVAIDFGTNKIYKHCPKK